MTNFKHIKSTFNPNAARQSKAAREAEREIKSALSNFKALYYGLRSLWWKSLDKGEIWRDAYSNGELEQYLIAPGCRDASGQYTPPEYDMERINQDFWFRKRQDFYEQFESEFWLCDLDSIPSKDTTMQQIEGRSQHVIEAAVELFADKLVNANSQVEPRLQVRLALTEINKANLERLNQRNGQSQRVSLKHAETILSRTEQLAEGVQSRKQQRQIEAEAWLAEHPEFATDEAELANGQTS